MCTEIDVFVWTSLSEIIKSSTNNGVSLANNDTSLANSDMSLANNEACSMNNNNDECDNDGCLVMAFPKTPSDPRQAYKKSWIDYDEQYRALTKINYPEFPDNSSWREIIGVADL